MSKNEEIIETNIDYLHNNYKSKILSYQQYIDFFKIISDLYKNFSDTIDQYFTKHITIIENQPLSLHPLLLKTENFIKEQAKVYKNFSISINKKIIEKNKDLIHSTEEFESKTYEILKSFNKNLKELKTHLEESHNNYQNKMGHLVESMISEGKSTKSKSNETKDKKNKINVLIDECKSEESKYEKTIDNVNETLYKIRDREQMMIAFYKSTGQDRINQMKDDVTFLVNNLKDVNSRINKKIEEIFNETERLEIEKDIKIFEDLVEKKYKTEKNVEFIPYEFMKKLNDISKITDKQSDIDEMNMNLKSITNLKNDFKNIIQDKDITETQKLLDFRQLCFNFLDKEKNVSFQKEDFDKLLSLIKVEKYCLYFLNYLTKERTNGKLKRSEKLINELGIIFNDLLIIAEKEKNYKVAKNIIILSQTFYTENNNDKDGQNNKKHIMHFIKDNKWIHTINFWEELINFEVVDNKNDFTRKNPNMDKTKFEFVMQNIYYSKTITYLNNMYLFGIEQKSTLELFNLLVDKYKINDNFKALLQISIENIYNPKKIEINININKEIKKKEIPNCEKISESSSELIRTETIDGWVICSDDNKTNNNMIDGFDNTDKKDFKGKPAHDTNNTNTKKKEKKSKKKKEK